MVTSHELSDVVEPRKFLAWYRRLYKIANCDDEKFDEDSYSKGLETKVTFAGVCGPGSHIEIEWGGEELDGEIDEGYIFTLPTVDNDDIWISGCVHIPRPCNPGGIGDVEPIWAYIGDLVNNPLIKAIRVRPAA